MDISRTYNVCKNAYWKCEDPIVEVLFSWVDLPAWFTPINHGTVEDPYYVFDFEFTPDETGTFTIDISGEEGFTGTITIVVIDCGEGYDHCNDGEDSNITWLNPVGGWSTYVFHGVAEKGIEIGKASTFKNSDRVIRFAERVGVYKQRLCKTDHVPKSHMDFIESLKYAIQAYLYNENTLLWDIPILIQPESFMSYATKDELFQGQIKFIYAEELIVQKQ